jgi:ABC-type dipeptide/oligopeptide/nickel transport system permease component
MRRVLARRAGTALLVVWGVSVVTFALGRLVPSDPVLLYAGRDVTNPAQVAQIRKALGLDEPLPVQYVTYVTGLLSGDWGTSISTKRPVLSELAARLPATLELMITALLIGATLGVLFGILAAQRPGGVLDSGVRLLSVTGLAIPGFWLGLLLQIVFFNALGLPLTGRLDTSLGLTHPIPQVTGMYVVDALLARDFTVFADAVRHLILPAITLAAHPLGLLSRLTRAVMIEAMGEDYIRTATSYGLSNRTIVLKLGLRNALSPILAVLGLIVANMLTGAFFVEIIFSWPGLGLFAVHSLLNLDYAPIMGITILGALGFVGINLAIDLLQGWVDPRIRQN